MSVFEEVDKMIPYLKMGNRYYKIDDGYMLKATKDEDGVYLICGRVSVEEFLKGEMRDRNTVIEFTKIRSTLSKEIDIEMEKIAESKRGE